MSPCVHIIKQIHSKSNVLFCLAHFFLTTSYECCMSHLSRILASSALLLHHLFHHPADSPRGPGRKTVQGQVWTSLGHLLPTCPLQDLPLHILKEKADKTATQFIFVPTQTAIARFFTQCSSENT